MRPKIMRLICFLFICLLCTAASGTARAAPEAISKEIFMFINMDGYENDDGNALSDATDLFISMIPLDTTQLIAIHYRADELLHIKAFTLHSANDLKMAKTFIRDEYKQNKADALFDTVIETESGVPYVIALTNQDSPTDLIQSLFPIQTDEIIAIGLLEDVIPSILHIYSDRFTLTSKQITAENNTMVIDLDDTGITEADVVVFASDITQLNVLNPFGMRKDIDDPSIVKAFGEGYAHLKLLAPRKGQWAITGQGIDNADILLYKNASSIEAEQQSSLTLPIDSAPTQTPEPLEDNRAQLSRPVKVDDITNPAPSEAPAQQLTQVKELQSGLLVIVILLLIFTLAHVYNIIISYPFKGQLRYSVETDTEVIDIHSMQLQNTKGRLVFNNTLLDRQEVFHVVFYATRKPDIIHVRNKGRNIILKASIPQKQSFQMHNDEAICIQAGSILIYVTFLPK